MNADKDSDRQIYSLRKWPFFRTVANVNLSATVALLYFVYNGCVIWKGMLKLVGTTESANVKILAWVVFALWEIGCFLFCYVIVWRVGLRNRDFRKLYGPIVLTQEVIIFGEIHILLSEVASVIDIKNRIKLVSINNKKLALVKIAKSWLPEQAIARIKELKHN